MIWFKDSKFQFDEVRVAWAFCLIALVVSCFEML